VLSLHTIASPAAVALRRTLGVPVAQYVYAKELGARPRLAGFAVQNADIVIAISEYARRLAIAVGARDESIRLVYPGVELPETVTRVRSERPTILTIARLEDRYKGHDVLMRAMPLIRARIGNVRWVIIGDGPLRAPLEDMAAAIGVAGCVEFLGSVSDEERNSWLSCSDVLVMPSRMPAQGLAGEGFGIVYLEANAYGIPAIGGNVAGAVDAIVDGETGLLVDPTDSLDLAEAVVRLLRDRDLAERLGRQGMERAQDFAWPNVSSRVEAVLLELAGRRALVHA
jgi:phosphatidylinositol alpha-1,6-mannosyltransferase